MDTAGPFLTHHQRVASIPDLRAFLADLRVALQAHPVVLKLELRHRH